MKGPLSIHRVKLAPSRARGSRLDPVGDLAVAELRGNEGIRMMLEETLWLHAHQDPELDERGRRGAK